MRLVWSCYIAECGSVAQLNSLFVLLYVFSDEDFTLDSFDRLVLTEPVPWLFDSLKQNKKNARIGMKKNKASYELCQKFTNLQINQTLWE